VTDFRSNRFVAFAACAAAAALVGAASVGTESASAKWSGVEGRWLAFERVVGVGSGIFVARPGGQAYAITQGASIDGRPAWDSPPVDADCTHPSQIPTHHRLAFDRRAPGGEADIFVVDVGGLEGVPGSPAAIAPPTNVTNSPDADETGPTWSPGGLLPTGGTAALGVLAFTRDGDVFVADETGGNLLDVTQDPADDANPEWSPDGRFIAFESTRGGTRQIWAVPISLAGGHPSAGTPYQVTDGPDAKHDPTWLGHSPQFGDPVGLPDLQIVYSVDQGGRSYLDSIVQSITDESAQPFTAAAGPVPRTQELTGDPGDDRAPAWSSGAWAVAYSTTGGGTTSSLQILRGSDTQPLTPQPGPVVVAGGDDTNPDWQPFYNCADPHPELPAPAPVQRTPKHSGAGSPGGGSGGSGGAGGSGGDGKPGGGSSTRCTIRGNRRANILRGTSRRDVICGGGGNDRIVGGRGNDVIDGGPGRDRISGGPGNDRITGGPGRDVIVGGRGRDRMDAGSGADVISAKDRAQDTVIGGSGSDRAHVDRGLDRVAQVETRRY